MMSWGTPLSVPRRRRINCSIRGTTTAGETAAITAPITAASGRERPKIRGASSTYPRISQAAGTQDISTAGRPTFFTSRGLRESPARSRMRISAPCRN